MNTPNQSQRLKTNLNRLFQLQYCDVRTMSDNSFLWKHKTLDYTPRLIPDEAKTVATKDFINTLGNWVFNFSRSTTTFNRVFKKQDHVYDRVICSLVNYTYSGGPGEKVDFVYNVDMTQQVIPYDERVDHITAVCLKAVGLDPTSL